MDVNVAFEDQEKLREQLPPGTIAINEIFYSIQGEGRFVGVPMIFVRFNMCRIGCNFCDTKYTWKFISHNTFYTPQELVDKIKTIAPKCKYVCMTGGEPFEQREMLYEVCRLLTGLDYRIQIETSGSIIIDKRFEEVTNWITCSPKSFNGANFNSPIGEIKILVKAETPIDRVKNFVWKFQKKPWISIQPFEPNAHDFGNTTEYPEETRLEILAEIKKRREDYAAIWDANQKKAIEICMKTGWQLSLQIHKYLGVR